MVKEGVVEAGLPLLAVPGVGSTTSRGAGTSGSRTTNLSGLQELEGKGLGVGVGVNPKSLLAS